MALSSTSSSLHLNPRPPLSNSFPFSCNSLLRFRFRTLDIKPYCSKSTVDRNIQLDLLNTNRIYPEVQRKKTVRKPKPSFFDQISEKWSRKREITINLPWRQEGQALFQEAEGEKELQAVQETEETKEMVEKAEAEASFPSQFGVYAEKSFSDPVIRDCNRHLLSGSGPSAVAPWNRRLTKTPFLSKGKFGGEFSKGELKGGRDKFTIHEADTLAARKSIETEKEMDTNKELLKGEAPSESSIPEGPISPRTETCVHAIDAEEAERLPFVHDNNGISMALDEGKSSNDLPWVGGVDSGDQEGGNIKKANTDLAHKTIPEHELKRLRNVALRMVERTKIGEAGITSAVVDAIQEKWKSHEIVKLRFEGYLSLNMKRTHDIVERKTGGLVIWRSGSSVVLFRGLNYQLDCVQSYNNGRSKGSLHNLDHSSNLNVEGHLGLGTSLSVTESSDVNEELDDLLDDLGPRFVDWTGGTPLPVDADLLPGFISAYKPPFRLLPHGTRHCLTDKQMTFFRRQARRMPPHFALGKNKELQGLAAAMVKLWEKSAIAKIAIKRGVLNTCNDKMAEDLKGLTGGTLLSRNKEYMVFYRGNDFLPPVVTEALKERERLTGLQHQEEEATRDASVVIDKSTIKPSKVPMVAGTLAETLAATSHWGKDDISTVDVQGMLKESAIAKRSSVVKHLEKKLALAKGKMSNAENALEKVQKNLEPAELPSDLEQITDEERFLYRKMGLSMKPYLLLGRRGVFAGTVENMHLHWKFRELVKIIVKGNTYALVKHIAISLEAESGGILVSIDRTSKGYAIILYRGKNYQKPLKYRPGNLLTKRQALARSIELQRREGLKHHISDLQERIDLISSELDDDTNEIKVIDDKALYEKPENT